MMPSGPLYAHPGKCRVTSERDNERPFKTLATEVVWSCPWYRVRQDRIQRPDGSVGEYNTIEKPDAVWIVPVTPTGEILLLRHYRYTIDRWCWEVPAGSVKQGQTLEQAAAEELHEEVGGTSREMTYLAPYFMANGICNEQGHFFLATGVTTGAASHEPAEVIEIHRRPINEISDMLQRHEISDGPSALALHIALPLLRSPAGL